MRQLPFFEQQIACDDDIIADIQRWNIFNILKMDAERDEQKRISERKFRELLEIEDLVPAWEVSDRKMDRKMVCYHAANKNILHFKEIYENWIYSDVFRYYTLMAIQNRLEREQFDAD